MTNTTNTTPKTTAHTEKHTPGPWRVGKQNGHGGISIGAGKVESVATVYLGLIDSRVPRDEPTFALPDNAQSVANARLIAAAPDLLEVCKAVMALAGDERAISDKFPTIGAELRSVIAKAERAISRATGGQG